MAALPKIQYPIFEFTMPSDKSIIKFRPFTVKEEKILLIAQESENSSDRLIAMRQIVNNCCLNLNKPVETIAAFDLEYAFLKIRAKSVGNIVELKYQDTTDKKIYNFAVNLDEVEVNFTEGHTNKIEISSDLGLIMKYPTVETYAKNSTEKSDTLIEIVQDCIDTVYDSDNVYVFDQYTYKEKTEFVESITSDGFKQIVEFFNTMPVLSHELNYQDSQGTDKKITLLGIDDFFQ